MLFLLVAVLVADAKHALIAAYDCAYSTVSHKSTYHLIASLTQYSKFSTLVQSQPLLLQVYFCPQSGVRVHVLVKLFGWPALVNNYYMIYHRSH